jgi:hypothetical protein
VVRALKLTVQLIQNTAKTPAVRREAKEWADRLQYF